jgi:hypothetical protein
MIPLDLHIDQMMDTELEARLKSSIAALPQDGIVKIMVAFFFFIDHNLLLPLWFRDGKNVI